MLRSLQLYGLAAVAARRLAARGDQAGMVRMLAASDVMLAEVRRDSDLSPEALRELLAASIALAEQDTKTLTLH